MEPTTKVEKWTPKNECFLCVVMADQMCCDYNELFSIIVHVGVAAVGVHGNLISHFIICAFACGVFIYV